MRSIVLIIHNVRSTHNVGSLLRTADGLGVAKVYVTGYTPYPLHDKDIRLPHIAQKLSRQIHKTALGAEISLAWQHVEIIEDVINNLRQDNYQIVAVEQAKTAQSLPDFDPPNKLALIVGREVEGIELSVLKIVDKIVEIPMLGSKESFNVVQASTMVIYHCRYHV